MSVAFASGHEAASLAAASIGLRHEAPARALGAALAGQRSFAITDAYGLRAAQEQLPAQAGLRVPMVMSAACEAHQAKAAAHAGWIVLRARHAQDVYDLAFAAVRIGEHADVRLPVLVAYDGVTALEKRRVHLLEESATAGFLGRRPSLPNALDLAHPGTLRPCSGDIELTRALQAARGVIAEVFAELGKLSNRPLPEELAEAPLPAPQRAPAIGEAAAVRAGLPGLDAKAFHRNMANVRRAEANGRLEVELEPLWKMTSMPSRLAPGHGACPGCGALTTLHQVQKVLEGDVVMLLQSGCASAVTAAPGYTAHRINVLQDLGGNGAAILSGLAEASPAKDVTFVMVTGDGGLQDGLAAALEAASRNSRMMILEYDNQGRMSAGGLPSHSTAPGHRVSTDEIFAACRLPYVFTASEGYPEDLMRKAAKAQWYSKNEGLAYGKVLSFCPLHWQTADDAAQPVLQAAIDSCAFPLYEVERGETRITYDPDQTGRRRPVADWLKLMGKTAALPGEEVSEIQKRTDQRWARLKALHEHPLL